MPKQRKLIENRKPRVKRKGTLHDGYEVLAMNEEFKCRLLAHPNGPAIGDLDGFELMTAGCAAERAVWGDEQFMEYVRQAGEDCREVSHNDYAHRMKVATFVDWLVKAVPLWNAWKAKQVKAPVVSERKRAEP